ncbi:MAG: hypothetical protein GY849_17015, partial [Deltaproteobacteria bacterium]|nr:hypothetical protein [Deltaproteobacteria bacterium]
MPTQKHIIKKQILELRFGSREEAVELQDEIGRIYQKKVVPVIDAYCSRYSEPDVIHRIDKLEIDIGRLTPGSLEKEFPEKVKEAIRKELPKKIPKTGTGPLSSHLELLRHFVKTGSLPWWAESLGKKGLEKVMEQLIKRSPEDVKAIISEAIRDETGLKRIIYQFSDPTLLDIVRLFSPGLQPYIADYKRDSEEIFRRIDPFRAFPRKEVRLEQWRGIFFGIVLKGGLGLDRVRFTRETLLYMASRHRMTYASLLGRMQRAAKALQEQGFRFTSGLPDRVRDIIKEIQPVESPERGP